MICAPPPRNTRRPPMTPRTLRRRLVSGAAALVTALALTSAPPIATAAPTDYQAEDATISQGVVESNHAGYTGTGFVNYDNLVGSYVEWTVTATGRPGRRDAPLRQRYDGRPPAGLHRQRGLRRRRHHLPRHRRLDDLADQDRPPPADRRNQQDPGPRDHRRRRTECGQAHREPGQRRRPATVRTKQPGGQQHQVERGHLHVGRGDRQRRRDRATRSTVAATC